jgi:hypothetical protein
MRKSYILAFAAMAVFAYSAITSASAFAVQTIWLADGNFILSSAERVLVDSELVAGTKLLLEDMKAGIETNVECTKVNNEGWIGPDSLDEVTLVEFPETITNNCTANAKCGKLLAVAAVNLPWTTELLLVGGVALDDILKGSGVVGKPGYLVECEPMAGLKVDDTCTSETSSADIDNNATEGDVVALFNEAIAETEAATCSAAAPTEHTGLVVGEVLILAATAGLTIAWSEG